jgi:transcription antitermination factor NusG
MGSTAQKAHSPVPLASGDASFGRQWFAIYTASRHEKRIAELLTIRQVEHFLPLYMIRRRWKNGLAVDLQLPLFPGYLFARFHGHAERVRILQTPGVLSVVGGPEWQTAAIADAVIEELQEGLRSGRIEPHRGIEVGKPVRILSGIMAGMTGILIRRKNDFRVVITLGQIMQSISIEVDEALVEPLPASSMEATCDDENRIRRTLNRPECTAWPTSCG